MRRFSEMLATLLARAGLGERTRRIERWAHAFADGVDRGPRPHATRQGRGHQPGRVGPRRQRLLAVGRSLGLDLGVADAVLMGAVAVLATAIPAAPGYVGTFELAATSTAAALGVPRPEALALAVLVHVITVAPLALAGAVAIASSGPPPEPPGDPGRGG